MTYIVLVTSLIYCTIYQFFYRAWMFLVDFRYLLQGGTDFVTPYLFFLFAFFWRGVYSKRKEFAPGGSKFFPLRGNSFSKGRPKNMKELPLLEFYHLLLKALFLQHYNIWFWQDRPGYNQKVNELRKDALRANVNSQYQNSLCFGVDLVHPSSHRQTRYGKTRDQEVAGSIPAGSGNILS